MGLVFLTVLLVAGMLFTLRSQIRIEIVFFMIYVLALLLALVAYLLVLKMRDLLYRKIIKIKEIKSTKMEIQTSAFKDLEMETN